MNVRRFVGRNAREAMAQARAAYGDQAVVLSNRPVPAGVEILAMPGTDVPLRGEREPARAAPASAQAGVAPSAASSPAPAPAAAPEGMSTVSFQEFLRERQRQDAIAARAPAAAAPAPALPRLPVEPARFAAQALREEEETLARTARAAAPVPQPAPPAPSIAATDDLRAEMKQMRALLAGQLASLSWFDTVRRSPTQTRLLRLMMGNGFSPALARYLLARLPAACGDAEADAWLFDALARNLRCVQDGAIQRRGGVFAVVGPTGVGKTTTTAKIAARFALEHGPGSVGLITVDTYRMAASDQLRAFGRILNIPVHTARDSASLSDLLDLFAGKKLVLVDTVGVGQRDRRVGELLAALPTGRLERLLVLNAGAQGEVLDEVVRAYGAGPGTRCAISKLDEAARCGAAVDVALRHQLVVEGFANGQRVPEDWHAARAQLLVQKALLKPASAAYLPDDVELGLLLTAPLDGAALHGAARA